MSQSLNDINSMHNSANVSDLIASVTSESFSTETFFLSVSSSVGVSSLVLKRFSTEQSKQRTGTRT